jgi:enoyl-CoA hydratase/carnithine racemase
LGEGENRINPEWAVDVSAMFEEVAASQAPRALVSTGSGKCFSLGLDLEWIAANPHHVSELTAAMHELIASVLELPLPTVAAMQGHAFAGGALFALAHDYRVMREGRGYFCLPEIDGRIPFTPGLTDLVRARLAPQVAHEALTSGRRYGGREAAAAGIVDQMCSAEELLPQALARAATLSVKDPTTYGAIKAQIYRDTLGSLRDTGANFADSRHFQGALAR